MHPEGFEIPIHQSAIKAQLVMGLPRQLALVLYTLIAALTLPLSTWYAIPPGLYSCMRCSRQRPDAIRLFGMCLDAPCAIASFIGPES